MTGDQFASAPRGAICTIAVPSLNQGRFLERTLASIFAQGVEAEVVLLDGGSSDGTAQVIERWKPKLAFVRSGPDRGQTAAINEGIARGRAPFVMWLNSDDLLEEGALAKLIGALTEVPDAPAAYGRAAVIDDDDRILGQYGTGPFSAARLARRCFIAQPTVLIRRSAWERVGGLDETLSMAFDYDLWWRLYRLGGELVFVDRNIASTRWHVDCKTMRRPLEHYREAIRVVRRHYGRAPMWWFLKAPFSIGRRTATTFLQKV